MAFEIAEREREGVKVLDVEGKLVLGGAASDMREKLRALQAAGVRRVVLNLAGCEYIDSSGLGALVMAATSMQRAGGALKLLNLNKRNLELMVVTKLTTVFEMFNDEMDAVNSFFPDRKIQRFDILEFVRRQERE
jgi:anti-sigma B factor antagonist